MTRPSLFLAAAIVVRARGRPFGGPSARAGGVATRAPSPSRGSPCPRRAPEPSAPGAWSVGLSAYSGNSFSWTQEGPGETPEDRRFLIDGEALVLDATVRRGLRADLDVSLRVPLQWRGGGGLDGFIDWWHRFAHVPDGSRPSS